MPSVTLEDLMSRARVHADQEDSTFVTDAQLKGFLNNSLDILYGKIITLWEDYYLTRTEPTFTGTSYTLPSDFFKLVSVRVPSQGQYPKLKKLPSEEEDYYLAATGLPAHEVRYQLEGERTLRFVPGFGSSFVAAKLAYIPLRTQLVEDEDTITLPQGWEEWAVLHTAIKMVGKAEQSTQHLRELLREEQDRITREAPKRDQNEPRRVQDVTTPTDTE